MPRGYVINRELNGPDRAAIEQALRQQGFDPIYTIPRDLGEIDPRVDVGVVCLPVSSAEEAVVNEVIQRFAAAGIRVVSIWLHAAGELPAAAEKFGSGAVGINSPQVAEALKGEAVWENASGEPRPAENIPRNRCK